MPQTEGFDLYATVNMVGSALGAVICTIGFQAAAHGLVVACVICAFALVGMRRNSKTVRPLLVVFRKISIFCVVLGAPGAVCLLTAGKLPQVNQLELNSFGLLCFWALVTAHLCMEEMNHQWFGAEEP